MSCQVFPRRPLGLCNDFLDIKQKTPCVSKAFSLPGLSNRDRRAVGCFIPVIKPVHP